MNNLFQLERFVSCAPRLIRFLPLTIEVVLISMSIGAILGLINAVVRYRKIRILSVFFVIYNSFMRGTPLLVQLMIAYFGVPIILMKTVGIDVSSWDALTFGIIALVLNECTYTSAIFYGAIDAVPWGQTEAALSVGMTYPRTFFRIILPQALRGALPALGNDFIMMFQSTSILFMIGIKDMVGKAQNIGSSTGHSLEPYLFIVIVYVIFSILLRAMFYLINSRLEVSH